MSDNLKTLVKRAFMGAALAVGAGAVIIQSAPVNHNDIDLYDTLVGHGFTKIQNNGVANPLECGVGNVFFYKTAFTAQKDENTKQGVLCEAMSGDVVLVLKQ